MEYIKTAEEHREGFTEEDWKEPTQVSITRATPLQELIKIAHKKPRDCRCGNAWVGSTPGWRCLMRLIKTHPNTINADNVRNQEQAREVIRYIDAGKSLAVVCRDGRIRYYDGTRPSPADRMGILACLNVYEMEKIDFDTAFDRAYALKQQDPQAYRCGDRGDPDNVIEEFTRQMYAGLTDLRQLPYMWRFFYTGELCSPCYGVDFVGGSDNPQASKETARQFFEMTTWSGILFDDAQAGSVSERQKAYLQGVSYDRTLIDYLVDRVNRISGMFAYATSVNAWSKLKATETEATIDALSGTIGVTYDDYPENPQQSNQPLSGDMYSGLGTDASHTPFFCLKPVLSPALWAQVVQKEWYAIVFIDTVFTRDILLSTVHDLLKKHVFET